MPDPQVLYVVTAVVVLALIAWVVAVLTRAGDISDGSNASNRGAVPATAGGAPPLDDGPSSKTIPAAPPPEVALTKSAAPGPAPVTTSSIGPSASAEVQIDVEEEEEPTGPHALILISAVGRTDPGLKRKHNEDAYSILEDHHLFVIADGMGRHAAGEVASKLAVEAIAESFGKGIRPSWTPDGALPKRATQLRNSILVANEKIFTQAHEVDEYAGMGTTVVACYFSPNNQRVYIAHVGDSRCYRYRGTTFSQLTKDHTLGAAGIQGRSSSVLSRAVGVEERVEVDLTMESPLPGDVYLLCSDGLSRMVTDEEISATLGAMQDLDACSAKLIDMANARGGRDNITTILVRVEDAPRTSSSPPRQGQK
ncbi:MAG: protein phosphatase 2C domain-containing protein [Polyangiaceae bacterium]